MTSPSPLDAESSLSGASGAEPRLEWLLVDGTGGFAASTGDERATRRYHGLLVTAPPGTPRRHLFVRGFRDEDSVEGEPVVFEREPWPAFTVERDGVAIRREVRMRRGVQAVFVRYTVSDATTVRLRPLLPCRDADHLTFRNDVLDPSIESIRHGIRCRPYAALPAVSVTVSSKSPWRFEPDPTWDLGVEYVTDLARGYGGHEDLFSPGCFVAELQVGQPLTFAMTIGPAVRDPKARYEALESEPGDDAPRARCERAAEDFLYRDAHGRLGVLAGFPWFGEWGRDTFIALPGLTMARDRLDLCEEVLCGALPFLADGLLPNIYGAEVADSHYGSVDAALWFARAVLLYHRATGDTELVRREFLGALETIAHAYREGTGERTRALGIRGDAGGLVVAGSKELNPTWMDARPASGAVTPRHGCPVEIAGLWCSLLRHLDELAPGCGWGSRADLADRTFLARFWLPDRGYLADVWRDGAVDDAIRPNMVLAAALELSPLAPEQRRAVVSTAAEHLLTPFGLRTLAPGHLEYRGRYEGDQEARDRAYHQGTVWPWLLGFQVEASLRVDSSRQERKRLRQLLTPLLAHLDEGGLDHICEVFDGDPPHRGGGSFAQAWSTAEILRALALLAGGFRP